MFAQPIPHSFPFVLASAGKRLAVSQSLFLLPVLFFLSVCVSTFRFLNAKTRGTPAVFSRKKIQKLRPQRSVMAAMRPARSKNFSAVLHVSITEYIGPFWAAMHDA